MIKEVFRRNKILAYAGSVFLSIGVILIILAFFNENKVLGINSMIKPIKFCISTWVYAWTLAWLLFYVENQRKVKWFSILATFVMSFENAVITVQALRGTQSHFNQTEIVGGILYALMGVFIVWVTTATLVLTIRFMLQKNYSINRAYAWAIQLGLLLFVVFSFFGGYMSAVNTHNVGGNMGGEGLPLLNWSTIMGDLRVAHFFGIHSLQIVPLVGYWISSKTTDNKKAIVFISLFALAWCLFVVFTAYQAIHAQPFIAN